MSMIELLIEMFTKMVVAKDASLIPKYYHEDFILYTNGQSWDYDQFLKMHEEIYQTPITYQIRYDERTFVEDNDRIAARVWITTQVANQSPKEIEVILIAEYKENQIYRLWELTYPDWSNLPEFEGHS